MDCKIELIFVPGQAVVPDAEAARQLLVDKGVDASPVQTLAWGSFTSFADPDGKHVDVAGAAAAGFLHHAGGLSRG